MIRGKGEAVKRIIHPFALSLLLLLHVYSSPGWAADLKPLSDDFGFRHKSLQNGSTDARSGEGRRAVACTRRATRAQAIHCVTTLQHHLVARSVRVRLRAPCPCFCLLLTAILLHLQASGGTLPRLAHSAPACGLSAEGELLRQEWSILEPFHIKDTSSRTIRKTVYAVSF